MRTTISLLALFFSLAIGTIPAFATQHHRPSYLPTRTVKTIPTITRPAPTPQKSAQPGSNNPSAMRVGAKNDSNWLIKNTFMPNERSLLPGQVNYSFVPGRPEEMQNLCVRAGDNNLTIDDDAHVFYFSGLADIQKFGNGFVRIQQKFLEWKNVAISNNVTKLEKEMTSANFPSRMVVGSVAYKVSAFFVVQRLYEGTSYKPFAPQNFETKGQAYISNHSRVFLEGIDFDLVYFPLKHSRIKSAAGRLPARSGEKGPSPSSALFASMALPCSWAATEIPPPR